ncbi:hypothetical protein N7471_009051 [Penicillium samsonianum]|uniref:uncharacterized protein n=1 Tax=Penicillium samsonianum TaxID=1882272 RepID=UPI002547B562|nr:uncharacterized protein N7471_009051 [Penicillium samsonianum]KAJ6127834.1 hypothetical protein N7471_009051 [Penicillium samsonianum]
MDSRQRPYPTQKIEITPEPAPNCKQVEGRLSLPFEQIHLRAKRKGETDFMMSQRDMVKLANRVWRAQSLSHRP